MIFELILIFILLFIILGLVYQFLPDIYTSVLILTLVFYIFYLAVKIFFWKKQHSGIEKFSLQKGLLMQEKKDTQQEVLDAFVKKSIISGYKEKAIRSALLKHGWPEDRINKAFKNQ